MRKSIEQHSELLQDNEWLQLLILKKPEVDINGYVFSHEKRCNGKIVAFLPYQTDNDSLSFLLRKEAVPCWDLENPILTCFTGGVDNDLLNSEKTMLKELEEEAGYIIPSNEFNRITFLGNSYGIKSSDTIYYLYSIDVTNLIPKELYIESELEKTSTNVWMPEYRLSEAVCPFVAMCYNRYKHKHMYEYLK